MARTQFKINNEQDSVFATDWIRNQLQGLDFPYEDYGFCRKSYWIGESLLLRKLILGIQAQVRGKSLTGLIIICDALIRPASTHKNPRGVFI
jgi:hypothetical protein